jgi:hypothetical protein
MLSAHVSQCQVYGRRTVYPLYGASPLAHADGRTRNVEIGDGPTVAVRDDTP